MEDTFPFNVTYNQDALLDDFSWQLYNISAAFDTPELDIYKQLSDKYSQVDWRISFVDVTAVIMEERAPELLDHVEFDEEGYLLDMYLDSDTALRTFIVVICPIFQQLPLLEEYMQRVANRKNISNLYKSILLSTAPMPLFAALDRLRADLDALRPLAPEQEARVLQKFRLEWNYNSNAIEGNSLTLGETRSLLLHGLTAAGKPMRDHLDIKGHNEAVVALEEFVRSEYPLTEQFVREMHQLLLGEPYHTPAQTAGGQPTRKLIVPGRYKTSPNNVLTVTGEMFYFASPEETPGRMTDLVDWYRTEEAAPTMHPVALAAEFHYRFVLIHPFDDGNGRMSRLLMNLILLRHGYPMTVIQAADRNRYLAALAEADAGEPEPFLRFIIENVEAGLRLMIRAARGESIDEPSDLDKKLALLKKQVLTRKDVIEMTWGLQTQFLFFKELITFWTNNLVSQVERFDELFLNTQIAFHYWSSSEDKYIEVTNQATHFKSIQEFINNTLESIVELKSKISFRILWDGFRMLNRNFDQGILLHFTFEKHSFTVSYRVYGRAMGEYKFDEDDEVLFTSLYRNQYDHAQIHEINYQLANKVYDFIAAKLAEADTPPA